MKHRRQHWCNDMVSSQSGSASEQVTKQFSARNGKYTLSIYVMSAVTGYFFFPVNVLALESDDNDILSIWHRPGESD